MAEENSGKTTTDAQRQGSEESSFSFDPITGSLHFSDEIMGKIREASISMSPVDFERWYVDLMVQIGLLSSVEADDAMKDVLRIAAARFRAGVKLPTQIQ